MSVAPSWLEGFDSCLRQVGEKGRIYPKGSRVEIVFLVDAANYLLLRTEGQGYINAVTLPETGLEVPVILPEKLQAVARRKMLHLLREYRDSAPEKVEAFVAEASKMGFKKAKEHLKTRWNCTIQPPIADSGGKATDLGMDGYCPACSLFGAALTRDQVDVVEGQLSIGIKTRVHFDPAFATRRGIVPATHNKVTEGLLSTTGQALYSEIHVEPGTVFAGRVSLTEVTLPELQAFLYTLAHIEEIGGRAGVYGTVRIHLQGIRCGRRSVTTALALAEELVKAKAGTLSAAVGYLEGRLPSLGFKRITTDDVLGSMDNTDPEGVFYGLWVSAIDYDWQWIEWIRSLRGKKK